MAITTIVGVYDGGISKPMAELTQDEVMIYVKVRYNR